MESIAKREIEVYLKHFNLDVAVRKAKANRLGGWDVIFDKVAESMGV